MMQDMSNRQQHNYIRYDSSAFNEDRYSCLFCYKHEECVIIVHAFSGSECHLVLVLYAALHNCLYSLEEQLVH